MVGFLNSCQGCTIWRCQIWSGKSSFRTVLPTGNTFDNCNFYIYIYILLPYLKCFQWLFKGLLSVHFRIWWTLQSPSWEKPFRSPSRPLTGTVVCCFNWRWVSRKFRTSSECEENSEEYKCSNCVFFFLLATPHTGERPGVRMWPVGCRGRICKSGWIRIHQVGKSVFRLKVHAKPSFQILCNCLWYVSTNVPTCGLFVLIFDRALFLLSKGMVSGFPPSEISVSAFFCFRHWLICSCKKHHSIPLLCEVLSFECDYTSKYLNLPMKHSMCALAPADGA